MDSYNASLNTVFPFVETAGFNMNLYITALIS